MKKAEHSALSPFCARLVFDFASGLADPWIVAIGMGRIRDPNDIDPAAATFPGWTPPPPDWNFPAESPSRSVRRSISRSVTDRSHDHMSGLSGLAYGGRDCAHSGSHVHYSKEFARVGDRGSGQARCGPGNIRNF